MTQTVEQLQQGVSNVVEVFSEIEDELEPAVYQILQPAITEAQAQLNKVAAQFNNLAKIQQLLSLINSHPEIKIDDHVFDILIARFEDQITEEPAEAGGITPHVVDFIEAVRPATFPDHWTRFQEIRQQPLRAAPFTDLR